METVAAASHAQVYRGRHPERTILYRVLAHAEVLRMLLDKELISEAIVDNLLSWRHSGFSAHGAVKIEDRQGPCAKRSPTCAGIGTS